MKLKLMIFLGAFAFLANSNVQAQTEEETIAWIQEKFLKYYKAYNNDPFRVEVYPCEIYITVYNKDASEVFYTDRVNPSSTKWSAYSISKVKAEHSIIKRTFIVLNKEYTYDFFDAGWEEEQNLAERMAKALNHLATFCEQGKGETF